MSARPCHCEEEETEAQKGSVIPSRSHSLERAQPELKPRQVHSRTRALNHVTYCFSGETVSFCPDCPLMLSFVLFSIHPLHLMGDSLKGLGFSAAPFQDLGGQLRPPPASFRGVWGGGGLGPCDCQRTTTPGRAPAGPTAPRIPPDIRHGREGPLNVAQIVAGTEANSRLLLAHKLSGTSEIDPH